jgi:hypothetical protein
VIWDLGEGLELDYWDWLWWDGLGWFGLAGYFTYASMSMDTRMMNLDILDLKTVSHV